MNNIKTQIQCPQCGLQDTWKNDNSFRPFCSERCKLIDLGEWASEKHQIPGQPAITDLDDESLD